MSVLFTFHIEARKEVYDQINRIVLGEAWFTPLLYSVHYAAAPKKVRNLDRLVGWDGKMDLRELWIAPRAEVDPRQGTPGAHAYLGPRAKIAAYTSPHPNGTRSALGRDE